MREQFAGPAPAHRHGVIVGEGVSIDFHVSCGEAQRLAQQRRPGVVVPEIMPTNRVPVGAV